MEKQIQSCLVVPPTQCNHATTPIQNATGIATRNATIDLKSLAMRVLGRNKATSNATLSATGILHIPTTERNFESCAVASPIERNHATQTWKELRPFIFQLIKIYGGTEEEWIESGVDSINEGNATVNSLKECYTKLIAENQPVINSKYQKETLV